MVYCGKASQGCQSCRTRRIKCDKVQPECTQCVRIRKPCPGYRDQLSLMFRDESSKVMQKAHAQWGVSEPSELGEASGSLPTTTASPVPIRTRSSGPGATSTTTTTAAAAAAATASPSSAILPAKQRRRRSPEETRLPTELKETPADKAIRFYIQNYIIGLPDEPRTAKDLQGTRWLHSREMRNIMAAVGLAAMSNLSGDKAMNTLAKQHYGQVLQTIASSMRNIATVDLDVVLRAVIIMAVYEVTRPRDEPVSPARTHVQGGAAILSSFLPRGQGPADGARGLLQLCFSMVAAKQSSFQYSSLEPNRMIPSSVEPFCDGTIPPMFSDWISICERMVTEADRPSAQLIGIVARFVQLAALVRTRAHLDGHPDTADVIVRALEIDEELEAWEARQAGLWAVVEERVSDPGFFPPAAVLDGCYHVYDNTYIARVWNHQRWTRILANQLLLESVSRFPRSSAPLVPPARQRRALACIARLARDTLVSVPTHYRHPALTEAHGRHLDKTKWGASIGIAGIPTLLFEIKVAACAPGVPAQHRAWALEIVETAYKTTGMFQARVLAEFIRKEMDGASPTASSSSVSSSPSASLSSGAMSAFGGEEDEEGGGGGGGGGGGLYGAMKGQVPIKVEVAGGLGAFF
ncbi:hypothetical protein VTJ83DRAFT_2476 [Remersonia thermophila]|uniref:Zn(2)-C6 fungal-type domain-containing protein n=1 Tax=Remersonia thermophila TaxID=72144 RepID=A0ABR4DIX2_9PEZI